jgi:hypothetical protein
MLVVIDPHPTTSAVLSERKNNTYLLPASTPALPLDFS